MNLGLLIGSESFKMDDGLDLLKDKQAFQRLTESAEKAKIELSTLTQTNIRYVYREEIIVYWKILFLSCLLITGSDVAASVSRKHQM